MSQAICGGCSGPLMADDQFCGNCGASAPPIDLTAAQLATVDGSGGVLAEMHNSPSRQDNSPDPFFWHAPRRPLGEVTNATRYLCAAAYLNEEFANVILEEMMVTNRAIAPSVGYDLGPIIRHCLNARRIMLARDILLTIFVLISFVLAPLFPFTVFVIHAWSSPAKWLGRGFFRTFLLLSATGFVLFNLVALFLISGLKIIPALGSAILLLKALENEFILFALFFIMPIAVGITEYCFTYVKYRTLSEKLRPGAAPIEPGQGPEEARIVMVEAAQHGNMILYGGENPFLGMGDYRRDYWQIAIELYRPGSVRQGPSAGSTQRNYVAVDPVELHRFIRKRLHGLKDPALPPNERISALTVEDHIVGEGRLFRGSPLLDMTSMRPYSFASAEAIETLIRHPQAGLRYYQRVSVRDEGSPVMSGDRQVIGGIDQGIAVSAFVYAAVEGGMFYLEFVRTALPPIHRFYRQIDYLPLPRSRSFCRMVIIRTIKSLFTDTFFAPLRLFSKIRLALRERRIHGEYMSSDDFGARISARELGAADILGTYIRILDVDKYIKIIERLLIDAVHDFLESKGVDTSQFADSAQVIVNGSVGQVSVGGHGHEFHQQMTTGHTT